MTMKNIKFLLLSIVALLFAVNVETLVAQEMTKEQWQDAMKTYTARKTELQSQLSTLQKDLEDVKSQSAKMDADVKSCHDALLALLGVSSADYEAFLNELSNAEKRVGEFQAMSDDQLLQNKDEVKKIDSRSGEMSKSNIAMIPSVSERIKSLQEKIAGLMKTMSMSRDKSYTVGTWAKDRDCLWNIAKKPNIYANAWLWPKIWQGNRDKIKDPDLIRPKWVLRIPEGNELTKQERSALNSYQRKKASAPEGTN